VPFEEKLSKRIYSRKKQLKIVLREKIALGLSGFIVGINKSFHSILDITKFGVLGTEIVLMST